MNPDNKFIAGYINSSLEKIVRILRDLGYYSWYNAPNFPSNFRPARFVFKHENAIKEFFKSLNALEQIHIVIYKDNSKPGRFSFEAHIEPDETKYRQGGTKAHLEMFVKGEEADYARGTKMFIEDIRKKFSSNEIEITSKGRGLQIQGIFSC